LTNSTHTKSIVREPEATASVLDSIPDCLKDTLLKSSTPEGKGRKSVLISSNNLANRFILSRWGIRPSQRRRYKNLFASIRKHCRVLFNISGKHLFGVYKFDEVRGNLILGFVVMTPESEWTLSNR